MLNTPTDNYGQMLYIKGRAQAISLERKRQIEKQLLEEKEMEEATFRPEIKSNGQRSQRNQSIKTEDFLIFQGRLA